MRNHECHVSDHDLVLALDGELPEHDHAAADAHLVECASCRTRHGELQRAAALVGALHRSRPLEAGQVAASRERLRSKLADMARRHDDSRADHLAAAFMRMPRWAMTGAAALATVLVVHIVQQSALVDSRPPAFTAERDALPVAALTPGAVWNVTVDELCAPGAHEQRPVTEAIRSEVVRGYGMERVPAGEYELDYLITPELGGAATVQNLWPQPYASQRWNAHVKDQLERLLPRLVCERAVSLETAQREIAVDWIQAYKKYFRTDVPLQARTPQTNGLADARDDDVLTYPIWRSEHAPSLRLISLSAAR